MEKAGSSTGSKCSQEMWFAVLTCLALFSVLLCFDYSNLQATDKRVTQLLNIQNNPLFPFSKNQTSFVQHSCSGKFIYVHDLPTNFNTDLLKNCQLLTRGTDNSMCPYIQNRGIGPLIQSPEGVLSNDSWYITNQFMLEVIFHNKMMHYKCLTKDSSLASAIFVPFYAGLDVSLRLWTSNVTVRDSSAREIMEWVSSRPEWSRMSGRDHFMIGGRISWDFRRRSDNPSDWGSNLRFLPQSGNMSMLSVEASSWRNDYAVPYPTYFHPAGESALLGWQESVRARVRSKLFAFAGAPRPEMADSIRSRAIAHCQVSNQCELVDCGNSSCSDPTTVMKVFENSVYCLQPPGDSYTRRSIFDSILAGCVPVFFHPGTAYSQYLWHLPRNYSSYSVYIPVRDVKELKDGDIEKVLLGISKEKEESMREEVIRLIPRIVYADPRSGSEAGFEDAFDFAVKGFLERVEEVREVIREGKDPSVGFAEEDNYKFTFSDWDKIRERN